MDQQNQMMDTLNKVFSGLNLDARCIAAQQNRHMAFYDVFLNPGCKVRRIEASAPEIALALRSCTQPIVKMIPSKGIVRLHTTLKEADVLHLDEIYNPDELPNDNFLPFLLGETDEGHKLWMDMTKNPHMLVAGGTGSGKSVFLHLLIQNVIKLNSTDKFDVCLWLSDPKRVEFNKYKNNESVLYISETYENTVLMLQKLEEIMESTYLLLRDLGISSIEQLPFSFKKHIVIIDELNDLMMIDKKSKRFETLLCKIAQRSRACGIYLCAASQRPSADVFSGLIKANFPARLCCKVASKVDSRVCLDANGGENLLGRGDAIIKNYNQDYTRFQVCLP